MKSIRQKKKIFLCLWCNWKQFLLSDSRYARWLRHHCFQSKKKEVLAEIKEGLLEQTSFLYEKIAREFVSKKIGDYQEVGGWWDKNEEIDVVGINNKTKEIIFGECKWTNKKVGTNVFENLKRKADLVDWHSKDRKEKFILFAKSGFTKNMLKLAREEKIILVHQDKVI